jgi:hypothetical protein
MAAAVLLYGTSEEEKRFPFITFSSFFNMYTQPAAAAQTTTD